MAGLVFGGCRRESDLVEIVLFEAGRPDRHHFPYHDLSAMGAVGCSQRHADPPDRVAGTVILLRGRLVWPTCWSRPCRSRAVDLAAGS